MTPSILAAWKRAAGEANDDERAHLLGEWALRYGRQLCEAAECVEELRCHVACVCAEQDWCPACEAYDHLRALREAVDHAG